NSWKYNDYISEDNMLFKWKIWSMVRYVRLLSVVMLVCIVAAPTYVLAQGNGLTDLEVFVGPQANIADIFMAEEQGFFKDEGLNVTLRTYPSGTTALQTFQTGAGDLVYSGGLPALSYWVNTDENYRLVVVPERNSDTY